MHTLAEQQTRLRKAIVSPASTVAADLLRQTEGREPLLCIYQHAYAARLTAALRDNHGVLPRAMGDEAFDALAEAYLQAHPSQHPSIRWFGHRLADFMAEQPELVPHPAFIDLARMEWALRDAFDAADATPLTMAEVMQFRPTEQWPDWVLSFHPSLRRVHLQWRIEPAWRALQQGDSDGDADGQVELPEPQADVHWLLVWRPALETRWRSAASALETQLLDAALRGQPFAALCIVAAREVGDDAAAAAVVSSLQQWIGEGLLIG